MNVFHLQHYFDDPEGNLELPFSLRHSVKCWKRPTDILEEKVSV